MNFERKLNMLRFVACLALFGVVVSTCTDASARCCRRARRHCRSRCCCAAAAPCCQTTCCTPSPTCCSPSTNGSYDSTTGNGSGHDPVTAEEEKWWQEM